MSKVVISSDGPDHSLKYCGLGKQHSSSGKGVKSKFTLPITSFSELDSKSLFFSCKHAENFPSFDSEFDDSKSNHMKRNITSL